MPADVTEVTVLVVMLKGADVLPAATGTLAGTVAEALELDSATLIPPDGAAAFSITVPVEVLPPVREYRLRVREDSSGCTETYAGKFRLLYDAVIWTPVLVVTAAAGRVNVVVVLPAGTVTLVGTVTALLVLVSVTGRPPVGAAAFRVSVPVTVAPPPPTRLVGLRAKDWSQGLIVSTAFCVDPLYAAVRVADIVEVTLLAVTENVFVVPPAGTVTEDGRVTSDVLLLERLTTAPFAGAGPPSVTVPVAWVPLVSAPITLVGFKARDSSHGLTVKVAVFVTPLLAAEIVTLTGLLTAFVLTANVAEVWPAATVTEAGTVTTDVLLLESVTVTEAVAAPVKVTVPVTGATVEPPVTLSGETVVLESAGTGVALASLEAGLVPLLLTALTT